MKKLLLTVGAAVLSASAFATSWQRSATGLNATDIQALAGQEVKVVVKTSSRTTTGWFKPAIINEDGSGYFATCDTQNSEDTELFTDDFVYTMIVSEDGQSFTFKNCYDLYPPLTSDANYNLVALSKTDDIANATYFQVNASIQASSHLAGRYLLRVANKTYTNHSFADLHMSEQNGAQNGLIGPMYFQTGNAGLTDPWNTGRTSAGCLIYTVSEAEVPSYDVTLKIIGADGSVLTKSFTTFSTDANDLIEGNCPEYFTATGIEGDATISNDNTEFTIAGHWDYPFVLNKVFRADLRKSGAIDNQHCTKWTVNSDNQISTRDNANAEEFNPYNLFYLKSHGYNNDQRLRVSLHSVVFSDEIGFTCGSENSSKGTFTAEPTIWIVKTTTQADAENHGIALQHEGAFEAHANDITGKLGVWNYSASQNDNGSFIRFFDLSEEEFENTSWTLNDQVIEFVQEALDAAKENPTGKNMHALFYPEGIPTEWFHMLNKETSSDREWSYLGYYPESGETAWNIYNKADGTRSAKIKSNFVTCGDFAGERTEATTEQIAGQLWAWLEGKDENAGKYCLVNKAYPKGAVSNVIVDNNGEVTTTVGNNASRWTYVENRSDNPDQVCWFDISHTSEVDGATYIRPTFVNPNAAEYIHMSLAGSGQKYQLMRYNNDEASAYWLMTPANFDPISEFRAHFADFEAMKSVIGGALPSAAPNSTTPDNVATLAAPALRSYAAQFDKKVVRVQNWRRNSQNNDKTYIGAEVNNEGVCTLTDIAATTYGADLWLMLVNEENKVTLRSLANGHNVDKATNAIVRAGSEANTVMFLIGNKYMNLHPTNSGITDWSDANDIGSIWYVTLAEDAFATPAAGEQYYRIVSDRWLSEAQSPNLAINGENRDASGEGEVVTRAGYGHLGNYWKLQAGSTEGAVKLVNLVDEYSLGGEGLATQQADGNDYYLQALEGLGYAIKSANSTEGNIYLNVNAAGETLGMTNNGAAAPAANSNFSDAGAIFYFLPASEAEVTSATERYIAAVAARIGANINDDTENIIQLVGEEKAAGYIEALNHLSTIAGVNKTKREGINVADVVNDAMNEIITKHIGIQHLQFSSYRNADDNHIDLHYLGVNEAGNLFGYTEATEESTLWTLYPVENGFKLYNEKNQLYVGSKTGMNNAGNDGHYPMVDEENAAVFYTGFNATHNGFYICEHGYEPKNDKAVIHLAGNSGAIKNWNTGVGSNSHWHIHALEDAVCSEAVISTDGDMVIFTLAGELTEMARENQMKIIVTVNPAEPAPASSRRRAAAQANTYEIQHLDIQEDNTFSLPHQDGKWVVSIPGGMLKTENGHTRAAMTSFNVEGSTVDIKEVVIEMTEGECYDLQGRRLSAPIKGINIINGRKYLLR